MPAAWKDDTELFALMRAQLFPAVVGDILDTMGFLRQFLSPQIRPLKSDMVIAGRAMPVLEANAFSAREPEGRGPLTQQPFGLLFQALDDLKVHEVYVATGCAPQFALWGGLMTTRAMHLKAAGAVLDGWSRDLVNAAHITTSVEGAEAVPGAVVTVHYVGVAWSNGQQFDASWDRNDPFDFRLGAGQVIPGWDQGVAGMRIGGRRQLTIPPHLGYGSQGAGGVIRGGETLVFVVDLLSLG